MTEALTTQIIRPPSVTTQSVTLIDLLRAAVDKGADVATLERLAKLYETAEAAEQKKAFDVALAAAKAQIKPILKDKEVSNRDGGKLYGYETFAAIAEAVDPILAEHGLYTTFPDSDKVTEHLPNRIYVTCRLSHRNGYSIEATMDGPPDVGQNRNALQAMGSTVTYLQRYTLKRVLGLAVAQDKDGAGKQRAGAAAMQTVQDKGSTYSAPAAAMAIDSGKPQLIEGREGLTWPDWSKAFLMMINAADTKKLVNEWTRENRPQLDKLHKDLPQHYAFVERELTKRLRKVK